MAGGNEEAKGDSSQLGIDRGTEVGKALLHLPEEQLGHHLFAQGKLRARIFERRVVKGCEWHSRRAGREFAVGPLDQVFQRPGNRRQGIAVESLYSRGHRSEKARPESRFQPEKGTGLPGGISGRPFPLRWPREYRLSTAIPWRRFP